MNEYDLLKAIGDINEKYIEKAAVEEDTIDEVAEKTNSARGRGRRKNIVYIAACLLGILVIVAIVGIAQNPVFHDKGNARDGITPTEGQSDLARPTIPGRETVICEEYQFLILEGKLYEASVESCDTVGAKIGETSVRSNLENNESTLLKNVIVYEIVNMARGIAVAVYFPDEQLCFVYYCEE
jgi:hypothetical protein